MAAEQSSDQIAQQIAQAVSEAIRQAAAETSRQVIDANRTASSQEVGAEREFETGSDESWKEASTSQAGFKNENHRLLFLNSKRSYDEYQHESLESIKRNRSYVDKVLADALSYDNLKQQLSIQALQNAVETANMVGKQAVRHSDVAIDHHWNLEPSEGAAEGVVMRSVTIDDASLKAIGAAVAAAVAAEINKPKA